MLEILPGVGEFAKSIGNLGRKGVSNSLSFAQHLLSGGEESAATATVTPAAPAAVPPVKPVTAAQQQGLDNLQAAIKSALQQRGITLDSPFTLSLDALGDVAVGDHANQADIQNILASDPALQDLAKQLLHSNSPPTSLTASANAGSDWIFASAGVPQNLVVDATSAKLVDQI